MRVRRSGDNPTLSLTKCDPRVFNEIGKSSQDYDVGCTMMEQTSNVVLYGEITESVRNILWHTFQVP